VRGKHNHPRRWFAHRLVIMMIALGVLVTACGGDDADDGAADDTQAPQTTEAATETTEAATETTEAATETTEATQEAVELTFVGPEPPEAMAPVIAAFEASHANITVQYEQVPFLDLNSVIQSRVGGGDTDPDVYTADQPRTAALVDRGLLLDLTDSIGDISDVVLQAGIEASSVDGRLYSLPISTSTQALFVNVDLLEAAGLPIPPLDVDQRMTWEEIKTSAAAAQAAGAEWGVLLDQVNRYYQLQPLPESAGGGSGIGPGQLDLDITNDGWVKAMEYYGSLFEEGLSPRGIPSTQTQDLFGNGQVAYFIGGVWWQGKWDGTEGLNWAMAPHPYFEGGEAVTPTGAWSWGVSPSSDNIEEAIEFIRYAALTTEGALAAMEGYPLPPANLVAYETFAGNQVVAEATDLIAYELANTARIRPPTIGWVEFEELTGAAFEDIRNGSDPAERLQQAQDEIERAWSRLG
jgi:ABC-type glycerol-3-phosphate transport system substrate-binding protein